MKKLIPVDYYELRGEFGDSVYMDEHVATLGYSCVGKLMEYSGFEEFSERLWVWVKNDDVIKDGVNIIVTCDNGNTYCSLIYMDMYIKELLINN